MQDIEPYPPFRRNNGRRFVLWAALGGIVIIVLAVIGLVLFGPKDTGKSVQPAVAATASTATTQPAPATPAPTATTDTTAPPAPPVVDLTTMTQADRRAFVQKLISQGVFTGVQISPAPPKVGVTPLFQSLNLDLKRQFISVVEAYVHNGAATTEPLQLIDATNGHAIGTYTVADGLKLS